MGINAPGSVGTTVRHATRTHTRGPNSASADTRLRLRTGLSTYCTYLVRARLGEPTLCMYLEYLLYKDCKPGQSKQNKCLLYVWHLDCTEYSRVCMYRRDRRRRRRRAQTRKGGVQVITGRYAIYMYSTLYRNRFYTKIIMCGVRGTIYILMSTLSRVGRG